MGTEYPSDQSVLRDLGLETNAEILREMNRTITDGMTPEQLANYERGARSSRRAELRTLAVIYLFLAFCAFGAIGMIVQFLSLIIDRLF